MSDKIKIGKAIIDTIRVIEGARIKVLVEIEGERGQVEALKDRIIICAHLWDINMTAVLDNITTCWYCKGKRETERGRLCPDKD